MEKEFVPYELAVKLKELGFKEKCIHFYEDNGRFNTHGGFEFFSGSATKAPLWQQAFDWLRVNHGFDIAILPDYHGYHPSITRNNQTELGASVSTYEEARFDSLKRVIQRLSSNPLH